MRPTLRVCRALAVFLVQHAIGPTTAPAQGPGDGGGAAWFEGAVCYQVFVRSFYDSDGDGIGDLQGLITKLDYINDGDANTPGDLGARCIWLMPVAQSRSYHGYDVTNYYQVRRDYGTTADFQRLIAAAERRGIRVLVDMVLNHVSDEHPFFKHALLYPDSPYRPWFLWSSTHPGVRNPWGGDNWHRSSVREEYYYGFFWAGMPDLNYEHPAVREEAKRIATFWLTELGAHGFRLDAVKHLVERDRGRVVEHVPATHDVLREYATHVRTVRPDAFTIGEVWDTTGAMLAYYPDQLDAYFAFDASDAIIEAVRSGSAARLLAPFLRLQHALPQHRWAPFLRNHDQTRTVTALGGDLGRARVAAALLLTLPGLPFVYYGEEIGMTGEKPDPRLRTPMHWRVAPAAGFTTGVPWEPLHPDSFTANVELQDADPHSLLNVYRRLIHLRAATPALAAGELVPLAATSDSVAAYLRRHRDGSVLVVTNLARAPLRGVTVSSRDEVLPAGRFRTRDLLGGLEGRTLTVGTDGSIEPWVPVPTLGPLATHVFRLERAGR